MFLEVEKFGTSSSSIFQNFGKPAGVLLCDDHERKTTFDMIEANRVLHGL